VILPLGAISGTKEDLFNMIPLVAATNLMEGGVMMEKNHVESQKQPVFSDTLDEMLVVAAENKFGYGVGTVKNSRVDQAKGSGGCCCCCCCCCCGGSADLK